jgi:pyruvate dehydrogenase E2 component (dihydrolipoamide acetyltransferase)
MYTAEGKLIRWLRASGARVEAGEAVVEIETEKAIHELEAPAAGILHAIANPEESLQVEALIGYVLAEGEALPNESSDHPASHSSPSSATATAASAAAPAREVRASPIARRLASENNIDLASLAGSGPGGRIVEADVRAALAAASAPATFAVASASAAPAAPSAVSGLAVRERVPMTSIRKTIVQRLRYAVEEAVPLTLTREVRADVLRSVRSRLAEKGTTVSYDAMLIKTLGMTLRQDPRLNASIQDDSICVYDSINVGFAVAVAGGLLVPVVVDADRQSLVQIEQVVRRLADAARAGRLASSDVAGGTVTVTNLGAYGVDAFTPVLNPPQAAILGVGRIVSRPIVEGDRIVPGSTSVLSLTFDHRVCDGAPAAQLLGNLANLLSDEAQLISWA